MERLLLGDRGTFRRRNTDVQGTPRQPGSHEPGHKAGRKEARE